MDRLPYRTNRAALPAEKRTADPGIVDDMVRQFADRYAFLRELVQNGIDAGAQRIDVRIEHEGDGRVVTSVADDGCGMARSVIEGPLLTLFSSSKEKDTTKIGKYGIGFVSVFAVNPEHVDVLTQTTSVTPKESWRVRLFGDHSYELTQVERPEGAGTTVTLVHASMSVEDYFAHVERSLAALAKWCRHARVPIEVTVLDVSDPSSSANRTLTINVPMTIQEGLVEVSSRVPSHDLTIVASVGVHPPVVGFYNRGLTLFEISEDAAHSEHEELRGISFKVDSPRLSHTLSRDTIKRDDAYEEVIRQVIQVVRGRLFEKLENAINVAARTNAAPEDVRLAALYTAFMIPAFRSQRDPDRVEMPLTDPIKGRTTMSVRAIVKASANNEVLLADEPSPMTHALATLTGRPVVRRIDLGGIIRLLIKGVTVETVDRVFAHVIAIDEDETVVSPLLKDLLCSIGLPVGAVWFAQFSGVVPRETLRVVPQITREAVTRPSAASSVTERAWGRKSTLFLNREDAAVRLARRRARTDPEAAAHLLARILLVTDGAIDAKVVDRLLEAAARS